MRQYEFIAFGIAAAAGNPPFPEGVAVYCHAPARWLLILPDAVDPATLDGLRQADEGVLVEVSGKYHAVPFVDEAGRRLLASTVNLEAVLPAGRDCAAVTLFDAPAVLARADGGFIAWVTASHVRDFTAAADRAGRICEKMTG